MEDKRPQGSQVSKHVGREKGLGLVTSKMTRSGVGLQEFVFEVEKEVTGVQEGQPQGRLSVEG